MRCAQITGKCGNSGKFICPHAYRFAAVAAVLWRKDELLLHHVVVTLRPSVVAARRQEQQFFGWLQGFIGGLIEIRPVRTKLPVGAGLFVRWALDPPHKWVQSRGDFPPSSWPPTSSCYADSNCRASLSPDRPLFPFKWEYGCTRASVRNNFPVGVCCYSSVGYFH